MKNKRITLILLAITIAFAVVAMVIVRRKGKVKKYDLQEDAKRYLQVYSIDNGLSKNLYYCTEAQSVSVNIKDEKTAIVGRDGMDRNESFVRVKSVIWDNGEKKRFANGYILKSDIVLEQEPVY